MSKRVSDLHSPAHTCIPAQEEPLLGKSRISGRFQLVKEIFFNDRIFLVQFEPADRLVNRHWRQFAPAFPIPLTDISSIMGQRATFTCQEPSPIIRNVKRFFIPGNIISTTMTNGGDFLSLFRIVDFLV